MSRRYRALVADLDPDARFLLANERTLLAWLRTSLALQAGGVGILNFGTTLNLNGLIGLILIGLGGLAGLAGFQRYRMADRAIRAGELPPHGIAPQVIAISVTVLAVLLLGVALGYELNL
jgi:putative membrane protein